ncbi:DUF1800 family protein [Hydrogenophaga sp.]|uniref:DUF1800 domain-containing protein n=1 Tax=Hydrogenophaga sp. TaxID=1904254 RepID=UPI002733106E|nr:DUF1800 domain-containing protein [Hydrogenophaga sp.]MDP3110063.1 DUF1800 domain-containing protein [Hydrogenophaga sp.]
MTNVEAPDEAAPTAVANRMADPADHDSAASARPALLASAAAATAMLAACGGGGSDGDSGSFPVTVDFTTAGYANAAPATDADAARFLQQAQFSSTVEDIASVRSNGYVMWLATQFSRPLGPTGWDWLEARGYGVADSNSYYFNMYPAEFMLWNQLLSGPDAMRRRMALALSEFFVASMSSAEFTWRSHAYASWWDMLVRNAFGNFRQLLEDVTLHPAMGWFLNTKGNQKENNSGRVPDENYAREVMQLFTIGLVDLNLDGTPRLSNGQPVDSYTQSDVTNLARVFTGYDFDTSDGVRIPVDSYTIESRAFARKPMALNESRHSTLAATFLGTTIAANTPGRAALGTALDTLFNHPNVGPFFARQMIQRLVTSNPSPAYVAHVAAAFNNNGQGVRGDLKAVWAAILQHDEARGPQTLASNTFGKLREPMLRFIQWARTFGAQSAAGSWKIFELSNPANQLGQSPLRAPSVFNFFRPGYVPPNTSLTPSGATAPEFQLVNETTVGGYLNFMQDVIERGINCPNPAVPQAAWNNYQYDVKAGYARELALAADATALVRHLSLVLCAGQIAPNSANEQLMVNALNATAVTANSATDVKLRRVWAAVLMVMACPQYLIQK